MKQILLAVFALFLVGTGAHAASILEACEADITTYCSNVEPGHGRISACLYAHEDKVSDACDAATTEVSDVIDIFFSRLREISIACGDDVQKHCSGVEVGGGRMISCLRAEASITEQCKSVIDTIEHAEN
ncbi:MAG: cysteine rich repeat-containing protein [Pseudomonadota bacterium]